MLRMTSLEMSAISGWETAKPLLNNHELKYISIKIGIGGFYS